MNPWNQKWCALVQGALVLEWIRSMLSGMSQIVWNSHPLCGLILLAALGIASPIQLLTCLWTLFIASFLVFLLKLPKDLAQEGLYTINPALAGIAVPLVFFQNDMPNLPLLFLLCSAASVLSLLLTVALRRWTTPRQLAPLGLPYSITLVALVLCTRFSGGTGAYAVSAASNASPWTLKDFLTAVCNGLAQVIWIEGVSHSTKAGLLVLLGIVLVSRIDALIALYSALLSTAAAVLLGLEAHTISLGLYGYGAVLLSLVLFGRAFRMNRYSFLLITILSLLNVPLTAAIRPVFASVGAPVAAVIWSLLAIGAMALGRRSPLLSYVPPAHWSIPEQSSQACAPDRSL